MSRKDGFRLINSWAACKQETMTQETMKNSSPIVNISIEKSLFDFIEEDARKNGNITVIGILIGYYDLKEEIGELSIYISDMILVEPTLHSPGADSAAIDWETTLKELEHTYPSSSQEIVGWYHSHPGYGIFLSVMDYKTHSENFSEKWQVALVVDPFCNDFGFFAWSQDDKCVYVPKEQITQVEGKKET